MSRRRIRLRGLHALYAEDPIRADAIAWGRTSDPKSRRGFLRTGALTTLGAILGGPIVFAEYFPAGLIPAALLDPESFTSIPGKDPGLTILNDRPLNAETPAHLLDDLVTPNARFFVRNNGLPPDQDGIDIDSWTIVIDGEAIQKPQTYTLGELKSRFRQYQYQLTLECAGNGRKEFFPPASGNQWSVGAVGCAEFTGVRLADVLRDAGMTSDAVYIGYYGADKHLNGSGEVPISRGVPMAKAMENESLIAWATQDGQAHFRRDLYNRDGVGVTATAY